MNMLKKFGFKMELNFVEVSALEENGLPSVPNVTCLCKEMKIMRLLALQIADGVP